MRQESEQPQIGHEVQESAAQGLVARELVAAGFLGGTGLRALVILSQIITGVILARALGPAQLGVLAVTLSIVTLVSLVFSLQLNIQMAKSQSRDIAGGIWPWAWISGAIAVLFGLLIAAALEATGRSDQGQLLRVYLPVLFLTPHAAFLIGAVRASRMTLHAVILSDSTYLLRFAAIGLVHIAAIRLTPSFVGAIDGIVLTVVVLYGIVLARGRAWIRWRPHIRHLTPILRALPALVVAALGGLVLSKIDTVMISYFLGSAPTGRYDVAVKLSEVPFNLYVASVVMFLPAISSLPDGEEARSVYRDCVYVIAWLMAPLLSGIAVFGDVAVQILFGPEFRIDAAIYAVLATGIFVQVSSGPNGHLLVSRHRHAALAILVLGLIAGDIGLNAVLIPRYGLIGAAVATTLSYMGVNVAAMLLAKRHLGDRIGGRAYLIWVAALLIMHLSGFVTARVILGPDLIGLMGGSLIAVVLALLIARRHQTIRTFFRLSRAGRSYQDGAVRP